MFGFIFTCFFYYILFLGGMQTEGSSDMPRFKNDITYIVPNIGFTTGVKITDQARVLSETRTFEDVRMKNKFMSVKAWFIIIIIIKCLIIIFIVQALAALAMYDDYYFFYLNSPKPAFSDFIRDC